MKASQVARSPFPAFCEANRFGGATLAAVAVLATTAPNLPTPAHAQAILPEIVVTARKREESLADVPIAITAVTGDRIQESNISDLASLAEIVPNFNYGESYNTGDRFVVRGLSTAGTGAGFEQAVGTNIDGFYYGRARFGRTMFLDLERVEVLKGPQGALIGKNNSAGALNITTRKPGDDFGGYALASYEVEDMQGFAIEAAVDIPFSNNFRGRLSGRLEDKEGWSEDALKPDRDPIGGRDDNTIRAVFVWDPSANARATLLLQYADLERDSRTRELAGNCIPTFEGPPLQLDDCSVNNVRYQGNNYGGTDLGTGDESGTTELSIAGLTVDWNPNDRWTVSSLTNFTKFDGEDLNGFQFNPLAESWFGIQDNYEQFSQELRLTGSFNESVEFIGGVYYNDNTVEANQIVNVCGGRGSACMDASNDESWTSLQANTESTQDSRTVSVFAQVDWSLSDVWTLSLGGRFTDESKDAQGRRWLSDRIRYPGFELGDPVPGTNFAGGGGCLSLRGSLNGRRLACFPPIFAGSNSGEFSRSESDFTPNAVLQWRPVENSMFYLSYAGGFKGGGYQLWPRFPGVLTEAQIEYDAETTASWEAGGKHTLGAGRMQLNWAAFSTTIEDLQVSSFDPILALINVTNAGEARSQGFEADVQWAVSDSYTVSTAAAYTDGIYETYEGAACWPGQTADFGCVNGFQDLSGARLFAAPEWQFSARLDGTHPIGTSLVLSWNAGYYWTDDHVVGQNDNPITDVQKAYGKLDASLSLSNADRTWKASLVGRNLTDEITANFAGNGNIPRNRARDPSLPAFPSFYFTSPGRQLALQVRFSF
ncbi:MAG: TonB-dependent receptor [Gammaproteobacteria bacterium]|nr:TonB-dependent receptor [Gammaproteobacteria bacterium]MDE0413676.1 TonB-dependent receptor [Gammaproteobacteria bacterium]